MARLTEHYGSDGEPPPFRAPWYLLGLSVALVTIGSIFAPARTGIAIALFVAGLGLALVSKVWTCVVASRLGGAWLIGAIGAPLVGTVALFKAGNLRPLGLAFTSVAILGMGAGVGSLVPRNPPRAANEAVAELTRDEFRAQCEARRDRFVCGCLTAALFDEVGTDVRERYLQGTKTAEDEALVTLAVTRNCGRR